jgi:hypothetical protein
VRTWCRSNRRGHSLKWAAARRAFVGYLLENTSPGTPNTLTFGVRQGVSLWN